MTQILRTPEALAQWRADQPPGRLALVPTMGNLHEGHLQLLDQARAKADRVVVSVFVNPTQFGPNEDFERYPRTADADHALLQARGCDAMYLPDVPSMYPEGLEAGLEIRFPGLDDILCGASRPGHFQGVARVVSKLLHHVQPDLAVFGRKDYQQFLVIRRLVEGLGFPVELLEAPIVRDPDGLAMSSRNRYLNDDERRRAVALPRALDHLQAEYPCRGQAVVAETQQMIEDAGFRLDYLSLRDARSLARPEPTSPELVALAAAWMGSTRLLDNRVFAQHDK